MPDALRSATASLAGTLVSVACASLRIDAASSIDSEATLAGAAGAEGTSITLAAGAALESPTDSFALDRIAKRSIEKGQPAIASWTGTSMAAGYASGAVSLVLERVPTASPEDVRALILKCSSAKTVDELTDSTRTQSRSRKPLPTSAPNDRTLFRIRCSHIHRSAPHYFEITTMRALRSMIESPNRNRLHRIHVAWRTGREPQSAGRMRALRQTTSVRRAIRGARSATNGVVGLAAAIDALSRGVATELLMTRRFASLNPLAAANMAFLATTSGAIRTTVSGTAEMELDLAAGGVAALLRRTVATEA